jgi:hypothetical protein
MPVPKNLLVVLESMRELFALQNLHEQSSAVTMEEIERLPEAARQAVLAALKEETEKGKPRSCDNAVTDVYRTVDKDFETGKYRLALVDGVRDTIADFSDSVDKTSRTMEELKREVAAFRKEVATIFSPDEDLRGYVALRGRLGSADTPEGLDSLQRDATGAYRAGKLEGPLYGDLIVRIEGKRAGFARPEKSDA